MLLPSFILDLHPKKDVPDRNKVLRLNCAVSYKDISVTRGASPRALSGSRYFSISKSHVKSIGMAQLLRSD